ncbi:MAG: glycine zipper 2TM domain-containing protein [Pseudomonadales bacterium]|nr:glycine zipper 2TM domain-containing protein [Pseudomonadales bacterium]
MKTLNVLLVALFLTALAGCEQGKVSQSGDSSSSGGDTSLFSEETCATCGSVVAIEPVKVDGEGSGAGAVIGAVMGGVLGNQIGDGSGRDAATAVGVIGGAVAGNEIEKKSKASTYYAVTVDLDQGGQRTVNVASSAGISIGTEVEIVGNDLRVLSS